MDPNNMNDNQIVEVGADKGGRSIHLGPAQQQKVIKDIQKKMVSKLVKSGMSMEKIRLLMDEKLKRGAGSKEVDPSSSLADGGTKTPFDDALESDHQIFLGILESLKFEAANS